MSRNRSGPIGETGRNGAHRSPGDSDNPGDLHMPGYLHPPDTRSFLEVSGTGRGKLLLFGEHAAVYGHPALGLPLPHATTVTLGFFSPGFGPLSGAEHAGVRFDADVPPEDRETLLDLLRTVHALLAGRVGEKDSHPREDKQREGETLFSVPMPDTLRIVSDLPRGLGFGSSAALCVATAAAFVRFAVTKCAIPPLGETEFRLVAHRAERLFHAAPSGIDTGLSFLPGLRLLRPDSPPADSVPFAERLPGVPVHLVAGAVARRSDTRSLIVALRDRLADADGRTVRLLARLGAISGEAAALFRSGVRPLEIAGGLGVLADEAQRHLREMDLSSPDLDRVLEAGRSAGAEGGKLSGAGGGGAFFLVARSREQADRIAERLMRLHEREGGPIRFGPFPVSLME